MNIQPLHDNVVVKKLNNAEVTASGIVLPDSVSKEKPMEGEVVAVGKGKMLDNGSLAPMSVQIGDKILFTQYAPEEVEVDGQEYLVISEDKILGIIK